MAALPVLVVPILLAVNALAAAVPASTTPDCLLAEIKLPVSTFKSPSVTVMPFPVFPTHRRLQIEPPPYC